VEIYLVQHAKAKSAEIDPDRSLTGEGRSDAEAVARLAKRMGVTVHQIRHSGKVRAEQTAEIFGQALSPAEGVLAVPGLGPVDEVEPVADELAEAKKPTMLVGHLPFMERLAGWMLAGDAERPAVKFHNAGIVCLAGEGKGWQVTWIAVPAMVQGSEG